MGLMSSKIEREKLRPGDHIYTWRSGYSYSHHGIYVGDGMVIHLTRGPGPIISSSSERQLSNDRVVCCNIEDFLCDGKLYRFKYGVKRFIFLMNRPGTCTLASSGPPDQVLHRASYLLEHGFGNYHLLTKNCEDFAIYCKTGLVNLSRISTAASSGQITCIPCVVVAVASIPYRLLPFSFIVAPLVFCGKYSIMRINMDVGKHTYIVAAVEDLNHLRDAHNVLGNRIEKFNTGWFLSLNEYVAITALSIRIWYWTPESRILAWFKSAFHYAILENFVFSHPILHGLKLGEYSAYTIWALGYWCWRSGSTILLCTRLSLLRDSLKSLISDHPTRGKASDNMNCATIILGLSHWTPGSTVLLWIKLALFYFFLFIFSKRRLSRLDV